MRLVTTALVLAAVAAVAAAAPAAQEADVPDRAALEEDLSRRLTNAALTGSFTDSAIAGGAPVGGDRYVIRSATKLESGRWRFEAAIGFTERALVIPLQLDVEWAGTTPVLVVEGMRVPFLGTYSARVVIHGDSYAGTWQGADHGGHLWGTIEPLPAARPQEPALAGVHWPQFRGSLARGVSEGHATPLEFDVASGKNIRWRVPVAGLAHSSPIVWGERVFLTTAVRGDGAEAELKVGRYGAVLPVPDEGVHEFRVLCLDKGSGAVLWDELAHRAAPAVKRHTKGSHAASTPATDGEHVVAHFGSEGLFGFGVEGDLLWRVDLGRLDAGYYMLPPMQWGYASSPVIHDGLVLVQCDVQGPDFLVALDVETGEEVWRTPREEVPTWGSPTVDVRDGRSQVILNGYKHIGAYDLMSGEPLWWLAGGGDIPVPTPIVAHDLVYLTNAHGRMAPILAVDAMASGELGIEADEHDGMVWSRTRSGNYTQTPLVYGHHLYCCNDNGALGVYEARTGEEVYRERVGGGKTGFTASAVAADGKLYLTSEAGEVHVVKLGPEFELLGVSDLGEECMATPAISEGALLFRTRRHLVCAAAPSVQ